MLKLDAYVNRLYEVIMALSVKKAKKSNSGDTVSVSFGAVTVNVAKPSESIRQANIEAGQAALQRGKDAIIKVGVKIPRKRGIPLYFGSEDRPGWMVRELNGKKTVGRFVSGRFRAEKADDGPIAKKQGTRA